MGDPGRDAANVGSKHFQGCPADAHARRLKRRKISKNCNWLVSERHIYTARMASAADVRDIMGLPAQETAITKDSIINADKKKKEKKKDSGVFQRPEGMHRFDPLC